MKEWSNEVKFVQFIASSDTIGEKSVRKGDTVRHALRGIRQCFENSAGMWVISTALPGVFDFNPLVTSIEQKEH